MTSVSSSLALDCVITNAIVLDAMLGVVKADTGIKGNRIHNSGQAGNPDFMNGVTLAPGRELMIVRPTTDETHCHCRGGRHQHPLHLSPARVTGPSAGTLAATFTTCPSISDSAGRATRAIRTPPSSTC
mmetsp:Transcript_18084/g.36408  ORF Transcript_18084/g.36408 Transcript_18084/m.36408 type:complete len:129 (+) Transcript_18084:315-701(+)